MAIGMGMWAFNQACWTWFEVVLRKPLPDPFSGRHGVVSACGPDHGGGGHPPAAADEREGMLPQHAERR